MKKHRTFTTLVILLFTAGLPICSFGREAHAQQGEHKQRYELSDANITRVARRSLEWDEVVLAHLIDVEVNNGVLTLSGSVDNLIQKERAVKIVEGIVGVFDVVDALLVNPLIQTDEEIRHNVEEALLSDPTTNAYEITVEVNNGVVTLSGTVNSWTEKQLSAEVARGVKGIRQLDNNIVIDYGTERLDSEIKMEIERSLEGEPLVHAESIDVIVEDGNVTLNGVVGSVAERSKVYGNAWVNGVLSVDESGLTIQVGPYRTIPVLRVRTDEMIEDEIQQALRDDPRGSSFVVNVTVEDSEAILSGVVDNFKARNVAEQIALSRIGIWNVDNLLLVRPDRMYSGSEIEQNVKNALARDPFLERNEITVNVLNQKAYLYGSVDTYFEKLRAGDVVSRVPGVAAIQNSLSVFDSPWQWKSDRELIEDIESEFFWSIFVDGDDLTVTAENGVVEIYGMVDDLWELNAAVNNAFEGGAKSVHSFLKNQNASTSGEPMTLDRWYYSPPSSL